MLQASDNSSSYTGTIYGYIRDQKYDEVVRILLVELENHPQSRAALSLLGFCYYHMQIYDMAVSMYDELCRIYPDVQEYHMYAAQSLYKAGQYDAASRKASQLDSDQFEQRVSLLRAATYYEQNDLKATRSVLEQCIDNDPNTILFEGAIEYKEGDYESAKKKFSDAMNILGYQPDLAYNIALCCYRSKQYGNAMRQIAEIIEKGIREHPELSVGSKHENNTDAKSVRNTTSLRESALIEAFNLKAAIEFEMKNIKGARDALADMPPRQEEELDPVSLHNFGLMNMDIDPNKGFKKLNFLLQNPPFPVETFANLLILYMKHNFHDLMADVLAENAHLTFQLLSKDWYEFMDATVTLQTSPEDAYHKYEELAKKHIDTLRKLTKKIQDARIAQNTDDIKSSLKAYDEALEEFMPVLMAQANIYWERGNYAQVEKIFRQTAEFCSEHEAWKLNVAHVFFLQGNKYEQAIQYYEPFVRKHQDNLLEVQAIILANLCVCYVMNTDNEKAEELLRSLEREEEEESTRDPEKRLFHLCIVNLVIGTLYCSKNNYDFGICRVMKSMEPYHRKLGADTWYYTKRCFLGLALTLAKHMATIRDSTMEDILDFFDHVDQHGKDISSISDAQEGPSQSAPHSISYEARVLKKIFLQLRFACPNKCSGHGRCTANDVCDCMQNWTGGDCSLRVCPYSRAWLDTAIDTNNAHYYAECSNRGSCLQDKGVCSCDDGFSGSGCRRMACPDDCSGRGTCEFIEELAVDTYDKRVGGNSARKYTLWDQEKIMGCRCDPWFFGHNCAKRMCPKGDDPLTANQNEMTQAIVMNPASSSTNVEGYLTFFDAYGAAYTTNVITFSTGMDCTDTLLKELQRLPNNVLNTVMVETLASPTSFIAFDRARREEAKGTATAFTRTANMAICLIRFKSESGTTGYQNLFTCSTSPHQAQGQHPIAVGDTTATCNVYEVASDTSGVRELSELAECSNRGRCDYVTGKCKCFSGHTGLACQKQEALV